MKTAICLLALMSAVEARADSCDLQGARVAAAIGASVRARADSIIHLRHPDVEDLQLHCDGPSLWKVSGGMDGPEPLAPAAQVIARTSSLVLLTSEEAAGAALRTCIRVGATSQGHPSEATRAGLTAECTVSVHRVTMELRRAVE